MSTFLRFRYLVVRAKILAYFLTFCHSTVSLTLLLLFDQFQRKNMEKCLNMLQRWKLAAGDGSAFYVALNLIFMTVGDQIQRTKRPPPKKPTTNECLHELFVKRSYEFR